MFQISEREDYAMIENCTNNIWDAIAWACIAGCLIRLAYLEFKFGAFKP